MPGGPRGGTVIVVARYIVLPRYLFHLPAPDLLNIIYRRPHRGLLRNPPPTKEVHCIVVRESRCAQMHPEHGRHPIRRQCYRSPSPVWFYCWERIAPD